MPGVRYFRCPRCASHIFSLRALFRHFHSVHGYESNWVCGLSGCMRTFELFASYKKHVYRNHPGSVERERAVGANELVDAAPSVGDAFQSDDVGVQSNPDAEERQEELRTETSQVCESTQGPSGCVKQLALLLLKWKEGRRLPESTLDEIINDVISFVKSILEHKQLQLNNEVAANVRELFCVDELDRLLTTAGRNAFWRTHLPLVEPRTVVLGTNSNGKDDTMEYVPLCDLLTCILEHPTLSGDFNAYTKVDNHMCSVFDGSAFRDHAYFEGDHHKICLQLYTDEFEVCNPLGSKRGKHKMTAVYFSVLNFPARFRSALSGMHLALLVNDHHVDSYGLPKILAPLLEDVSRLETEGIVANGKVMRGSVFVLTGDNLSSHRMGGFKRSFNKGRICRFCMAVHCEINYKHLETDFVLRTPEGHEHHMNMLKAGLPTASLYGVTAACALTCQGFNATQHFPPDVMHDLHEGVIPFALRHIISSLISQGLFTLAQLNKEISEWNYDPCDARNKPEPISSEFLKGKATMKGSATQVFCLFRHLTFFVGECVPTEHEVWQLYLLFREIMDIIMSRKIPVSHIGYLQRKIHFFCLDFKTLFPSVKVPCKMHYLIHYPSCMERFGPLVELWAMRFEGKHQYFKDMARKIRNFKSLSHSLAVRHQFLQCFSFAAVGEKSVPITTGCRPILCEHLPECVKEFISQHDLETVDSFVANSVSIEGRVYKTGCVLVQSVPDDALPEFLHICQIFYVNKVLLSLGNVLETVRFDEHFHVYVVRATQEFKVVTSLTDCTTEPLYMREHKGQTVISARHSLL
ncbi:uncharacterized protein LOC115321710 [Ixodes scapularis]|uniref:uncharacterized protein LOC115321710 n=1 Tax=Ixodes scapularis TaxID=6945 RepID=UPI001A9EF572|nr:uncharacterized protein LOC115321710 [Ixodes scapularis]